MKSEREELNDQTLDDAGQGLLSLVPSGSVHSGSDRSDAGHQVAWSERSDAGHQVACLLEAPYAGGRGSLKTTEDVLRLLKSLTT